MQTEGDRSGAAFEVCEVDPICSDGVGADVVSHSQTVAGVMRQASL
jgi:hypothetical protein